MSDRFHVLRMKGSGPFGAPIVTVLEDRGGASEVVAHVENEALARRITVLLNRNGMVDVPLPSIEEEEVEE